MRRRHAKKKHRAARAYLEQPWRYSGDVAGITGEETRAARVLRGRGRGGEIKYKKVSGVSFRLV